MEKDKLHFLVGLILGVIPKICQSVSSLTTVEAGPDDERPYPGCVTHAIEGGKLVRCELSPLGGRELATGELSPSAGFELSPLAGPCELSLVTSRKRTTCELSLLADRELVT